MKPKTIFDLIVRTAGLVVLLYGLGHLLYGVLGAVKILESTQVNYNGIFGVCELVLGLFMMRGMTPLVDLAFPSESPEVKDDGSSQ